METDGLPRPDQGALYRRYPGKEKEITRKRPRNLLIAVIVLILVLGTGFGLLYSARQADDRLEQAYSRFYDADPMIDEQQKLLEAYNQLDDERLTSKIKMEDDGVIGASENMNKIVERMNALDTKMVRDSKSRANDFIACAADLGLLSTMKAKAKDITARMRALNALADKALAVKCDAGKLLKQVNSVYIRYANGDITGEEFTEQKKDLDKKIQKKLVDYQIMTAEIDTKRQEISQRWEE